MRTHRHPLTITVALLAALILGGCTMNPNTNTAPQKTGEELRTQILDYIQDTITATGLAEGWKIDTPADTPVWDPTTVTYSGRSCSTIQPTELQRFSQEVLHDPVDDPIALSEKVADHWKDLGYQVGNVITPRTDPTGEREAHIRADLPGGAFLGFFVSDQMVSFDASTECSTDPSLDLVTGPDGYEPLPELTGTSTPE